MINSKEVKRIVFKVGTSSLTYDTGKINIRRMSALARVLSALKNAGKEIVLVTSGAIGVGVGKLGLGERPHDTPGRQAAATVGQLLVTRDDFEDDERRRNLHNTFMKLFEYGAIPVVNENDSVAVEEIVFGDNDSLSAHVAKLVEADALVILTDIDGLFSANPREDESARLISSVDRITDEILALAGGSGTSRGTGGMITKLHAGEIATSAGIDTVVMNGSDPEDIYKLLDGRQIGTHFKAQR